MKPHTIIRATVLAATVLALAACTVSELDKARVDCGTPGAHGVDCTIKRTAGIQAFEACWDLAITCKNGGAMRASACHAMAADGQVGTQNMPAASFTGQDSCDVPASGQVEGLKITVQ